MSNITVIDQSLPDFLQTAGVSDLTKQLAGNSGVKRIVPKNGIFRKVVGKEEMGKIKGNLNAIVVSASPKVGRIFYAKQWTPDAEPTAPDCFSNDGAAPDAGAQNPQAARCDACPQNIKGSGMGNSKSCRYSRRLALVLEEDFGTSLEGEVYQMNLASKSLFGEGGSDNAHTFENYAKYLANNGKSLDYVVTQISFNEDNDNQSVLFTPARFINKNEYAVTSAAVQKPEVHKMVVMTPYQADASGRQQKLEAPKAAATAQQTRPMGELMDEEEAAKSEPTVRPSKKAATPAPEGKKDLNSVLDAWTKEE
jgi:hypothetical protein